MTKKIRKKTNASLSILMKKDTHIMCLYMYQEENRLIR